VAKSIIFDMDGTMIDNMMVHHRAWQRKLKELGMEISLEEVHQKVHGVNVEILERLFGDRFTPEERQKISDEKEAEYRKIFEPELTLVDGLAELLHDLKGKNIPMGVGSAAPPVNVDFVMNNLDLWHYFDAVKHSDDVETGKPHPEIYFKVAEELGVETKDCLVFEDTPAGAEAARRAGCDIILVTTTHQPDEFTGNDKIVRFIHDFTELSTKDVLHYLTNQH
jgi:HAD superfamily hydrolase (TIGR01509 family)